SARRAAALVLLPVSIEEPIRAASRVGAARKTFDDLALAEIDAPLAEARLQALKPAIAAERLEDAGKKDTDAWKSFATAAAAAQRLQGVLEARRNLELAKQQGVLQKPETVKKVADGEKALASAEASAKQQAGTNYTKRAMPNYPATSSGRRL